MRTFFFFTLPIDAETAVQVALIWKLFMSPNLVAIPVYINQAVQSLSQECILYCLKYLRINLVIFSTNCVFCPHL